MAPAVGIEKMTKRIELETRSFETALSHIGRGDAAEAKAAARCLNRAANGNWTQPRKEWFTHPERIGSMLQALAHADPEVAVEIIGALGALSQRCGSLDPRIHDALLVAYDGASDPVRLAVAQSIPQFGTPTAWQAVLAALEAKPPRAAQQPSASPWRDTGVRSRPP